MLDARMVVASTHGRAPGLHVLSAAAPSITPSSHAELVARLMLIYPWKKAVNDGAQENRFDTGFRAAVRHAPF
jgi:hypothetical protein